MGSISLRIKMKIIIYLIVLLNSYCLFIFAQERVIVNDSLKIFSNNVSINSNLNLNNAAMIQQVGNYNEANINQAGNCRDHYQMLRK